MPNFLNEGIHLIGTLKKNKKEIPFQLLPAKNREINSNTFAFNEDLTMVSYVPKYNKAVILISTLHHSNDVSNYASDNNKSNIILFYNKTKGWVDTFDQMIEHSSCRRKTLRWTFNLFCYIIDASDLNAFNLFKIKKSNTDSIFDKRSRRILREELAIYLITFGITERIRNASVLGFTGMNNDLLNIFSKLGFKINKQQKRKDDNILSKERHTCNHNICGAEKNKNKYYHYFESCKAYFCPEHGEIITTKLCKTCISDT